LERKQAWYQHVPPSDVDKETEYLTFCSDTQLRLHVAELRLDRLGLGCNNIITISLAETYFDMISRYPELFRRASASRVSQTDRRTDILIANAVLNCVARLIGRHQHIV